MAFRGMSSAITKSKSNVVAADVLPAAAQTTVQPRLEVLIRESSGDSLPVECLKEFSLSKVAAKILVGRGLRTRSEIEGFLNPTLKAHLPNPTSVLNIVPAADLILSFVESKKQITIYTDFDVDGLSSGAQLFLYLEALGARVNSYTPSRFTEGYGLVMPALEKLVAAGTELLITVDCGISSHRELEFAARRGMRTVVIDHHLPNGKCPADVVVDPAQEGCPFQDYKLCAAGLVWMMLIVLRQRLKEQALERGKPLAKEPPDPKSFLDLAALGTICDMVPLVSVNRVIAHRGIEALKTSKRPGLVALKQVSGIDNHPRFGAGHVAFNLGPRINAAGRLADANEVFRLLTTKDSLKARAIADSINRLNEQRRTVEDEVKQDCLEYLAANPEIASRAALALFGESYHLGVIGIVAQRLVEAFNKPAAVMAPGEATISGKICPVIKGSVRSVRGFHVADALQALSPLLVTHGGHAEAGGFSLLAENLVAFQQGFSELALGVLGVSSGVKTVRADLEVSLADVDFCLAEELQRFAPFGVGNPTPVLVTYGVDIQTTALIGEKHLKLRVTDGKYFHNVVAWSMYNHPLLRKGQRVNIAYVPEINSFNGVASVQLHLKEVWCTPPDSSLER